MALVQIWSILLFVSIYPARGIRASVGAGTWLLAAAAVGREVAANCGCR